MTLPLRGLAFAAVLALAATAAAETYPVKVDRGVRAKMRDGIAARRRRLPARFRRPLPDTPAAHALRPQGRGRPGARPRRRGLRRGAPGHARALRLGGRVLPVPERERRRVRFGGVGRRAAVLERSRRDVRWLVRWRDADARRRGEAAATRRHLSLRHRVRVLRRLDVPGRRPHALVRELLGVRPHRRHAAPQGGPEAAAGGVGETGTPRGLHAVRAADPDRGRAVLQGLGDPRDRRRLLEERQGLRPLRRDVDQGASRGGLARHLLDGLGPQLPRDAPEGSDAGRARGPAAADGAVGARRDLARGQDRRRGVRQGRRARHDGRHPRLVRLRAARHRERLRHESAREDLRDGRERLALRVRVPAGKRRRDALLPAAGRRSQGRDALPAGRPARHEARRNGTVHRASSTTPPIRCRRSAGGSAAATRSSPDPRTSGRTRDGPTCSSSRRRPWPETPR